MTRQCDTSAPACGFSLVELLVAMTVAVAVTSTVFALLAPANGALHLQAEAADVDERLRAVADTLLRDVATAGALPAVATVPVSSVPAAAVLPLRAGRRGADGPGTFDATRLTFWSVAAAAPQARAASSLASSSGSVLLASGPGCPPGDASCGFRAGMTTIALASSGAWDLYTVAAVQGMLLTLQHNLRDAPLVYPAGDAVLAEASLRTYFLKADATGVPQVLRYDGAAGADVPVIDHVARLAFELWGESEPPLPVSVDAAGAVRVTYGPPPPPRTSSPTMYGAGENCAFARTSAGAVVPRLDVRGHAPGLTRLDASVLTDGPWCPDASSPNRYDADLLRVRQVVVSVTTESAVAAFRGPAGPLFTRGGTARGSRLVPDRTTRLVIAPAALNAGH